MMYLRLHKIYLQEMSCAAEVYQLLSISEFEYLVFNNKSISFQVEGRRGTGNAENGIWQLDGGRRVLGKKRGGRERGVMHLHLHKI